MKPPSGWAVALAVLAAIEEREAARAPRTDCCGVRLLPGDWLTRDGCCYCDAGLDLLTPWGAT